MGGALPSCRVGGTHRNRAYDGAAPAGAAGGGGEAAHPGPLGLPAPHRSRDRCGRRSRWRRGLGTGQCPCTGGRARTVGSGPGRSGPHRAGPGPDARSGAGRRAALGGSGRSGRHAAWAGTRRGSAHLARGARALLRLARRSGTRHRPGRRRCPRLRARPGGPGPPANRTVLGRLLRRRADRDHLRRHRRRGRAYHGHRVDRGAAAPGGARARTGRGDARGDRFSQRGAPGTGDAPRTRHGRRRGARPHPRTQTARGAAARRRHADQETGPGLMSAVEPIGSVRRRLLQHAGDRSGAAPDTAVAAREITRAVRETPGVRTDAQQLQLEWRARTELLGSGSVIQPLLDDSAVSDVLINGDGSIWVDRGSGLVLAPETITQPRTLAARLAAAAGQRLDDAAPVAEGRLPDGTRLHAVLAPLSAEGAAVSLRTSRRRAFTLTELTEAGATGERGRQVIEALLRVRANGLVSGATGSGKTTLV